MIPDNHTVKNGDTVYDAEGVRRVATCSCANKPRLYTARYINANKALYSLTPPAIDAASDSPYAEQTPLAG